MENNEDNLIQNGLMFIYVRQNKPTAEKIENIENALKNGADINFVDANDKNNTILHIAAQKNEKDVVEFLLKKGALILYNLVNKTPIHIAKENETNASEEVLNLFTNYDKHLPQIEDPIPKDHQNEAIQYKPKAQIKDNEGQQEILYPKRDGTSGVSGQFYETKLLSLIFHRALHDKELEEYYLATNIRDVGEFDDVCFRFKTVEDGKTKHVMCFTQAKHRDDPDKAKLTVASVRSTSETFSLVKYFDSFLKIKLKFQTKSKNYDPMFEGDFNDINCYFIFYTPLKESFDRKLTGNKPVCQKLHSFIYTGEKDDVFQFNYEVSDIIFLSKYTQRERVKVLGQVLMKFILSKSTKEVMTNELIQIYHPALAKNVINLKVVDDNLFEGGFREEFFDTDDDLLMTLKETLFKEIVFRGSKKTELTKEEVKNKVKDIANNPSALTISALIGEVILFDDKNNKLCLNIDKIKRKKYKQEEIRELNQYLQKNQVSSAIVNDAINISGREKLKSLIFQLPRTFGNIDFPSNSKEIPIDRLKFIANKFYRLIEEERQQLEKQKIEVVYPIVININNRYVGSQKILETSHLNNKGIGGTVGNLLQFDTQSQTYTFNTNEESLGKNAKFMLNELKQIIGDDLSNYKFRVKMNNFPRTCFDANENDKELAEEFLNKLWFYTNQAKEEKVETILKKEIDCHYNADKNQNQFLFRVHSDAIFLRFHDEIQKWWKTQAQARYLTKTDPIFDEAKKGIINHPVLTVLNVMFLRTLKKFDIEFNAHVLDCMNINNMFYRKKIINILTDAVILSAAKIMQLFKYQTNYTFVNLDYVHFLPENDYRKMMNELKEMKEVILTIVCETQPDEQLLNTLNKIINIYNGKIIIITNKPLQEKIYQNYDYIGFEDKDVNLNDLNSKSQAKILKEFKVHYQGREVVLSTVIDSDSTSLIHAKILQSLLNKTKLEIGNSLGSYKYYEIKDYYINRSLYRKGEEYEVTTLNDIEDNIVLITSKPCMGKTILLTHLSLETKKVDPQPWIVQINLSAQTNEFKDWPAKNIHITNIMRFLCKAALKKTDAIKTLNFTKVTDETVEVHSDNPEDITFELEWFVHFYNQGKIIFLFDGFDRIHPHYTKEGFELLMALKQSNKRMWITSHCYIKNILQQQLAEQSYKLGRLTTTQQESFLQRFWKTNLKLEKLNHQQIDNVSLFINFIIKSFNGKSNTFNQERPMIHLFSIPLHIIYLTAIDHFKNEVNSLSPKYLSEKIKQKWRLDSYTVLDRFLRSPDEEEESELAGTPLHMYIAANYFKVQITDKFKLNLNSVEIVKKSNVYLNAVMSYAQFLKCNIKHVCEAEHKTNIEVEQNKIRDDFLETHKKLALYAICKESDVPKLLSESEISEVKTIIKRIESGEINSHLIDCVVDGVPKFYNLIFAEYFIVEFLADLIKRACRDECEHLSLESIWNFVVNGIILFCPPGVRNAFEYKLKYDPELAKVMDDERNDKVVFELILKQNKKAEITGDTESPLKIAINEGLVNITNIFLRTARRNVNEENVGELVKFLKAGAFILGATNPCWKNLTGNMIHIIQNVDAENLIKMANNSKDVEAVARTITDLCTETEFGKHLHETIRNKVCEPIRQITDELVASSSNNENLTSLVELLPYHLPGIINSIFGKK